MRRIYPWEEWFGRRRSVLMRGIDYHCSQSTMAQTVRNNASARGLKVRVVDTGPAIIVEVRDHDPGRELSKRRDRQGKAARVEGGALP